MASAPEPEATTKNEAIAEASVLPGKRKLSDSAVGSGRSSKVQATASGRITRSRFKKMNENSAAPNVLNPGLETKPRRRREPGGRKTTRAATQPQDAIEQAPEIAEQVEDRSAAHSSIHREVTQADIAAASRLAQAAIEAGLMTASPTRDTREGQIEGYEGHESQATQDVEHAARVVDDTEVAQDGIPPTQPDTMSPLPTAITPHTSQDDREPDNSYRGADQDQQPDPAVAAEESPDQAKVEVVDTEPETMREPPEGSVPAGADGSQEEPKEQLPTPTLPDQADNSRAQGEASAPEQVHSPTKPPVSEGDKTLATSQPLLLRSSGFGGEADSPVEVQSSGGLDSTQLWQPQAIRARDTADIARIVGPVDHQGLIGPVPRAVSQWEPDHPSGDGRGYSPEVFEGSLEQFELQELDDDVDP